MRWLVSLVALLTAAGCAIAPITPRPTEVPFERLEDGRVILQVTIDGAGPYPFVLDTGASVTILDLALVAELDLAAEGYDVVVHSVTGSESAPAYAAVAVGLGKDVITPAWVVGMDLTQLRIARGILGVDVLRERVVEIDGDLDIVRLGRAAYSPPSHLASSRAELVIDAHGLPHVLVTINEAEGLALLDTGLSGMIIDPDFAARARVPVRNEPIEVIDVLSEQAVTPRSGRARLRIGAARWSIARVALLRPPVLDELDAGAPTEAILGASVFEDLTLVIDFARLGVFIVDRPEFSIVNRPA